MKVLMFSIDKKIFEKGSQVRERMIELGRLFDELHIIVYTKKGFKEEKISANTIIYPTNLVIRELYPVKAFLMGRKIMRERSDFVMTTQEAMSNVPAIFLRWFYKVPLQLQIHGDIFNPRFVTSFRLWLQKIGYQFGIKHVTCIRTVTERIANSIRNSFPGLPLNISVLPVFVDVKKYLEAPASDLLRKKYPQFKFVILMASRFEPEKNIQTAVKAMKKIAYSHQVAGLVIVGAGGLKQNYFSLIKKLKLGKNVVLETWAKDLTPYYKSADIFLCTSEHESYGMTLVEAAASGCPIVTTNVGLVGEVLDSESVTTVPHDNPEAVAEAIMRLRKIPQLRDELARRAKEKVANFPTKEEWLVAYKNSLISCT